MWTFCTFVLLACMTYWFNQGEVEYEHLSLRVNAAFEIMMIIIMVTKD